MPSSVVAANPITVMPFTAALAFQQSRVYTVDSNFYVDGNRQSILYAPTSRRKWNLIEHATAAQLAALEAFYLARGGGSEEFWFYDVFETEPIFSYDITGSDTIGRYPVRFDGGFQSILMLARNQGQISLIEVG